MTKRKFAALFLSLVVGRGFAPPVAFAQTANRLSVTTEKLRSQSQEGRLLVVAFRDGLPAGGIELSGTFGILKTQADGTLSANLPVGRYSARAPLIESEILFNIYENEETQITLQILAEQKGTARLLEPRITETSTPIIPKQNITIRVISDSQEVPVAGASVLVAGQDKSETTNAQGIANINVVSNADPITIFHPKFQSLTTAPKAVIRLKDATNDLEEVVVLAPKVKGSVSALVEVRRQSSAVTDVLGSEQMARAGDSDAASSLRRVTGLTLMNGKYVYVRGLGERYSGVQMNAFSLPSPEPARRVVPLDLFPTSVLESIVVQKSYSPDLPGEFGGGIIQLKTKSLPQKFFFRASLATNFTDAEDRLTYQGGQTDWIGFDDGSRKLPSAIESALASGRKLVRRQAGSSEGMSEGELTDLGRSLPNNYRTRRSSDQAPPNMTLSSGTSFKVGPSRLGVAAGLLYGQSVDTGQKVNNGFNVGSGDKLVGDYSETSNFSEAEVRLAGSLDVGWEMGSNHQVGFNTFLLRHTTDFTQEKTKISQASPSSTLESTTLEWTERQLWTNHLKGQHKLFVQSPNSLEFAWRAGVANAERLSPNRREYAFERTPDSYQMRSDSGGNRRTDSKLEDQTREFGIDITIPLSRTPERMKLKLGASHLTRERRSDVFRLFFQQDWTGVGPVPPGASVEERFKPENIGPGGYMLQNLTDAADSYSGEQSVNAQFAMIDYTPWKSWSFQAGARHEVSKQRVSTFRYFEPDNPFAESNLEMRDILPAYSAVWKPNDQWRARLAYSETLARPEFREMSTVGFIDDETGYEVQGNPKLKGTVIKNIDHRWEYYFTSDEYASIGGFYKKFENPIEVMFVPGVNKIQTFDNAKAAENYGAELEARVGLRHVSRTFRRWSILGNYTLITSAIELDDRNRGIQTSNSRPLQGQSPYSVNFQLQYDRPAWGFSATALYNIVGPRITEVGTNQIPDTYEQSVHQFDFVASKSIAKNMNVGFRARNLIDPAIEARQNNEIVRSFRRGRTMGVSLNAVF